MANKDKPGVPRPRRTVAKRGTGRRITRRGAAPAAAAPFDPVVAFPPAPASPEDPRELEPRDVWFGGQPHQVRALGPADEGRLISFFNSHTDETIRQRYGYHISEMTPERARRLVGVDQSRDVALGVFERAADGAEVLHAVGRYLLDGTGRTAEMAFVVRENKRGLGVCTSLLHALLGIARHRGLGYLYAQVQADNAPMLAVFRRHGGRLRPIPETDTLEVFVPTLQAARPNGAA